MQYKPSKWVPGYKYGPASSYVQITRMGLFLNVSTSKFEPLDSTWDNLHSGGMFISGTNKIYFRDETNKDIYINSPADNQITIGATSGVGINCTPGTNLQVKGASGYQAVRVSSGSTEIDLFANSTGTRVGLNGPDSAEMDFYTNDTLHMTIDTNGAITAPLQPAFQAHPASNQDNIAINTDVTIIFGTEIFDQGGDFASNTFTAPVTGKYQLNVFVRLNDLDSAVAYYQPRLVTSNRTYYVFTVDPRVLASDPVYWSFGASILVDMDADDTAYVVIFQSGGTAQTDVDAQTRFSGHLAC